MKESRSTWLSRREAINLLGVGAGLGFVTALRQEAGLAAVLGQAPAAKVTFPKGAIIRTILKDVSPEALGTGATLFHDHLSMSSPRPYAKPSATPPPPQWLENVDAVIEEVKAAAKDGISCIVTGGTRDLGQKPENVRRIAEAVAPASMSIVLSDALWTQPAYPPDIPGKTEDQIAEDFLRDAKAQRWGALGEVGSSMPMHADERKVFRAVAKVHLRTGLPIFTHTPHEGCKTCGKEQLDIFESMGVNPHIVCIGHLSDIRDDPKAETQIAIAKRGPFVGFDTVGHTAGALARGEEQARMVLSVIEAGYEDHVLLSADGTSDAERKHNGGPGYAKVLTVFVPRLRAAGVKEATIHKILVDNPRRFLAFVPKMA
jgi:predicted metal-dependent phosphotriesterase family hydrolase